jgi:hypothetical protein
MAKGLFETIMAILGAAKAWIYVAGAVLELRGARKEISK